MLVRVAASLAGVVILQILTLVLVVAVFAPPSLGIWFLLFGIPIAIANLVLRFGKRLHEPKVGRRPGKIVVAIMFLVLMGMAAVLTRDYFGGELPIFIPIVLLCGLVLGVRGSISTSLWIEDSLSARFQEYSFWPVVIGMIVALARIWTMRPWDLVTIFALAFLGWWLIQLIGDLILAWTSIVAIGHRHKLDGIESRRRDREAEWARER